MDSLKIEILEKIITQAFNNGINEATNFTILNESTVGFDYYGNRYSIEISKGCLVIIDGPYNQYPHPSSQIRELISVIIEKQMEIDALLNEYEKIKKYRKDENNG